MVKREKEKNIWGEVWDRKVAFVGNMLLCVLHFAGIVEILIENKIRAGCERRNVSEMYEIWGTGYRMLHKNNEEREMRHVEYGMRDGQKVECGI